jgi:hypothetical protein
MKTRSKSHPKRKTRKGGMDALTLLIGTSILYGVFGGIANAVKSRYNSEQFDTMPSEDTMPSDMSETMPSDDSMPSDMSETMPSEDTMPSDMSETMPSDDSMPSDMSETMPSDDSIPSDMSETMPEVKKGGRRTRRR